MRGRSPGTGTGSSATLRLGVILGGASGVISHLVWGRQAALAAVVFAGLAVGIQIGAFALVRPVRDAPFSRFMARWGAGMGLRLLGVVLLVAAVALDRNHFPPLPVALSYLGVLIPLLVLEVRLLK